MGFIIQTDVSCDSCTKTITGARDRKAQRKFVWKRALEWGWGKIKGETYCPECQKNLPWLKRSMLRR